MCFHFQDPHNHYSGVLSWNGHGLLAGFKKFKALWKNNNGDQKLASFKSKCRRDKIPVAPERPAFWMYQFLHSGKVCGREICDKKSGHSSKELCDLMKMISRNLNVVLARELTSDKA